VGEPSRVGVTHPRLQVGVGVDLADLDAPPEHPRKDLAELVGGIASRAHQLVGGAHVVCPVTQDGAGHVGDVVEVHHGLATVQRPGQLEHATLEDGNQLEGQHVVRRLQDRELEAGVDEVLLDVALDLVLHQPGGDGVENRAEHDVLHTLVACGVHDAEPHLPLLRMQSRPDVIDGPDTAHHLTEHGGFAEVAHDHVLHAEPTKRVGRGLCLHAGAYPLAGGQQLGHQQSALVAVGGRHEDHGAGSARQAQARGPLDQGVGVGLRLVHVHRVGHVGEGLVGEVLPGLGDDLAGTAGLDVGEGPGEGVGGLVDGAVVVGPSPMRASSRGRRRPWRSPRRRPCPTPGRTP